MTSTVACAARNHLERVGWGTPTSGASAEAVFARGPIMRCTIFDLKASLYSVIVRLLSASCYAAPDTAQSRSNGVTTILTQGETEAIHRRAMLLALEILAVLDPRLRDVFMAHDVAGTPMREIAAKASMSVNTAWNLLRRARGEIQARVERHRARERGGESGCRRRAVRA